MDTFCFAFSDKSIILIVKDHYILNIKLGTKPHLSSYQNKTKSLRIFQELNKKREPWLVKVTKRRKVVLNVWRRLIVNPPPGLSCQIARFGEPTIHLELIPEGSAMCYLQSRFGEGKIIIQETNRGTLSEKKSSKFFYILLNFIIMFPKYDV